MALSKFLDPKNDFCFKQIFGTEKNKDILIHFLNDILKYEGSEKITEVTFFIRITLIFLGILEFNTLNKLKKNR